MAVTCFASNVARLESIALAARDAGRSVALVGRSLRNIEAAARECGYLRGIPEFVPEDEAGSIPDDNLLILVTGSQGEPRSALARIAMDTHPNIALGEGDTVIFSSRVIPGNERAIGAVQDNLVRRGVRLMTDMDHLVHVSGHPARDELRKLYRLVRPATRCRCMANGGISPRTPRWRRRLGPRRCCSRTATYCSLAPGRPR